METYTDQEIIECALLLDSDLAELCFEKLRDIFSVEPTRVALLIPLFDREMDDWSLRVALAIVIVSVMNYEPAMVWLVENEGWTENDFRNCKERFSVNN